MQLEQEWEGLSPLVAELVVDFEDCALGPEEDRLLNQKMSYRRGVPEAQGGDIAESDGCVFPFAGPQFAVIGQVVAKQIAGFVVGEKLIPASAPAIVIRSMQALALRSHQWIVPQQVGGSGLVVDLPDLCADFRENEEAQQVAFECYGTKAMHRRHGFNGDSVHSSSLKAE